ncbi:MAG: hypothetical protein DMF92_02545 [Acidobacteria bacterium]|nr:MAG: hypothetical protein DMF92_02545 [Acidobacteriota bacterium]
MSCCLFLLLWTAAQFGQSNTGELRLTVTDPSGLPIQGAVELVSEANQLRQNLETDTQGAAVARRLPFGMYHVDVQREGFATFSGLIEIRSALPTDYHVTLGLAPRSTWKRPCSICIRRARQTALARRLCSTGQRRCPGDRCQTS